MKTYFYYNDVIASKEATEAIAMIKGTGPIFGFGQGTINTAGDKITLYPLPVSTDPLYTKMKGRQYRWNIHKSSDQPEFDQTNFAGVSKDGYVFGTDDDSISLDISGTQGSYREVLVFARHTIIEEAVENPVSFEAYWSESSNYSFYTMYKKSIDPYYPTPLAGRVINFNSNPGAPQNIDFENLMLEVEKACNTYKANSPEMVLMGIYGTGYNSLTSQTETFALVPYDGNFPQEVGYTQATNSALLQTLQRLENIIGANSSTSNSGITTIATLLSNLESSLLSTFRTEIAAAILPVGSIILWSGTTIPDGWQEYSLARGRMVLGYTPGGITLPNSGVGMGTETVLTTVGDIYDPVDGDYASKMRVEDIPAHRHGVGLDEWLKVYDSGIGTHKMSRLQNYNDRWQAANGNVGDVSDGGSTINVSNGSVYTGLNFTDNVSGSKVENWVEQWNGIKLPKTIALRYIIKVS